MRNYYNILGVSNTASIDEIKRSHRKLSLKFHPDKNDGDILYVEMFHNIKEAYDILSDDYKRKDHDQKLA